LSWPSASASLTSSRRSKPSIAQVGDAWRDEYNADQMALANIVAAFGLAGAAGLNAYIPLLIVAILARLNLLQLSPPFDALASWPAIIALVVLGLIEFVADKVPGVDHVNDAIQTFVRPAAGAILFAANTGVVTGIDTTLALNLRPGVGLRRARDEGRRAASGQRCDDGDRRAVRQPG
jgi:hypothetical protein